ncbi:MAG: hypothetical protein HOV78_05340 [Hamadaea sp.]|nr:hypothetical protein [Hamadaea sp.]NUT06329.1 hypothetical protein [Hamadaea sp.]
MTEQVLDTAQPTSATPHPALKTLDTLVGTWTISGPGHDGTVTYEWMPGGHFLIQHVHLIQDGHATHGVEYIGYDADSGTLRSHYFGSSGDLLEYTYDITGRELTIWFGQPGSPAYYRGTFDESGDSAAGAWTWPGGGYESTMTRVHS